MQKSDLALIVFWTSGKGRSPLGEVIMREQKETLSSIEPPSAKHCAHTQMSWRYLVTQRVKEPALSLLWLWFTALAQVPSLVWEIPHVGRGRVGSAKKKINNKSIIQSVQPAFLKICVSIETENRLVLAQGQCGWNGREWEMTANKYRISLQRDEMF